MPGLAFANTQAFQRRRRCLLGWLVLCSMFLVNAASAQPPDAPPSWWKGNLHTHSLWSDGDDYPEMIVEWYKTNGYHFLTLSDHNVFQAGPKWVPIEKNKGGPAAFARYEQRWGTNWVERRLSNNIPQVRLKTFEEFRPRFNEPGRFLLLPGEELSDRYKTLPLHLNAHNIRERIAAQGGTSVVDVLQRNVDAVLDQRARTGQPMTPHINHPNFGYGITAEELMQIRGERFFEVYNGHPAVHNEGDEYHPNTDRMWDIMLAFRLSELNLGLLYGLGVDDAHHYHALQATNSNAGRGWIMVRSRQLTPQAILLAMETGQFYATSGVLLEDVLWKEGRLSIRIRAEPGVTYTTQFIGTRRGFDPTSKPGQRPPGGSFPVTRLYSAEIGQVLAQSTAVDPAYAWQGDELYIRAKIVSSKPKANASQENETETAWVQPVLP